MKFYLDADLAERARRRHLEHAGGWPQQTSEKVKGEMEQRDRADSERDIAPLVRPEGAIYMDTTGKGVEEVVEPL